MRESEGGGREREREGGRETENLTEVKKQKKIYYCLSVIEMDSNRVKGNPTFKRINLSLQLLLGSLKLLNFVLGSG